MSRESYSIGVQAAGYERTLVPVALASGATETLNFSLYACVPSGEGEGEGEPPVEGEGEGEDTCPCPEQVTVTVRALPAAGGTVELEVEGETRSGDQVSCVVTQGTPIRVKATPAWRYGFYTWGSTPASPISDCRFEEPPRQEDWFFATEDLEIDAVFGQITRYVDTSPSGYVSVSAPGCTVTGPCRARATVTQSPLTGYVWGHWTWGATADTHQRYEPTGIVCLPDAPYGNFTGTKVKPNFWRDDQYGHDEHLYWTYHIVSVTTDEHGFVTGYTYSANPSSDPLMIVAAEGEEGTIIVADEHRTRSSTCSNKWNK